MAVKECVLCGNTNAKELEYNMEVSFTNEEGVDVEETHYICKDGKGCME